MNKSKKQNKLNMAQQNKLNLIHCPECESERLFKCQTKQKCLDCEHEFEGEMYNPHIEYRKCTEEELWYYEERTDKRR